MHQCVLDTEIATRLDIAFVKMTLTGIGMEQLVRMVISTMIVSTEQWSLMRIKVPMV
jgi:hypothetical protein